MNRVAPFCEQLQHHPRWTNVYHTVEVDLCTHDAGNSVTMLDIRLASTMDKIFDELVGKKKIAHQTAGVEIP